MAIQLFVTPQEIAETTILGGNVDIDNYQFAIHNVMITTIEPLLGTELYDKIYSEWVADTLAGDYLTLFTEYVQPITKFEATSQYIQISSYKLTNRGLFKNVPDNGEVVDKEEAQFLGKKYSAMAQMYVQRFSKWIGLNVIAEYKTSQDDVNADGSIKLTPTWYL